MYLLHGNFVKRIPSDLLLAFARAMCLGLEPRLSLRRNFQTLEIGEIEAHAARPEGRESADAKADQRGKDAYALGSNLSFPRVS